VYAEKFYLQRGKAFLAHGQNQEVKLLRLHRVHMVAAAMPRLGVVHRNLMNFLLLLPAGELLSFLSAPGP
jgi:hypothetical protein